MLCCCPCWSRCWCRSVPSFWTKCIPGTKHTQGEGKAGQGALPQPALRLFSSDMSCPSPLSRHMQCLVHACQVPGAALDPSALPHTRYLAPGTWYRAFRINVLPHHSAYQVQQYDTDGQQNCIRIILLYNTYSSPTRGINACTWYNEMSEKC